MSLWTEFIPTLSPHVKQCPQPVMLDALRRAGRDFCTQSKVWQETLDDVLIVPSEREIEVEHPDDARVVAPLDCYFDANPITARTSRQLAREYQNWRLESGTPLYLTLDNPDVMRLCPHPSVQGTLTPRVVLAPALDGDEVPDWLYEEHRDAINYGAAAILKAIGNEAWTDLPGVAFHEDKFRDGINKAFADQSRGFSGARIRTTLEYR